MKIKRTNVFRTFCIDQIWISTVLSLSFNSYLCLPPAVGSMHFGIEAFRRHIAGKAALRGINDMVGIGWQPHKPSHDIDDVVTLVCDIALVIPIVTHILESV